MSSDDISLVVFLLAIGSIITIILIAQARSAEKRANNQKTLEESLSEIPEFEPFKTFINPIQGMISIDEKSNRVVVKKMYEPSKIYYYKDILSCSVIEDDETVHQKSTLRTVGGAVAGGILAGGAGLVVGGLSGKNAQKKLTKNLDLKIVFKDTQNPSFIINFFDSMEVAAKAKGVRLDDPTYGKNLKKALVEIKQWKDTIDVIIDRVDSESKIMTNTASSLSDELSKLHDLKTKGILSEEEFQQQKKKLLG